MQKTQPEKKFKAGSITATVWENHGLKDGKDVRFKTISLARVYKDKNDEWQQTNSFRVADLPKAALVMSKAYEYLALSDEEASA